LSHSLAGLRPTTANMALAKRAIPPSSCTRFAFARRLRSSAATSGYSSAARRNRRGQPACWVSAKPTAPVYEPTLLERLARSCVIRPQRLERRSHALRERFHVEPPFATFPGSDKGRRYTARILTRNSRPAQPPGDVSGRNAQLSRDPPNAHEPVSVGESASCEGDGPLPQARYRRVARLNRPRRHRANGWLVDRAHTPSL
jgi:hypothetical protein